MFGRGHGHGGVPPHPPPPPPSTIEQLLAVQTHLMQALVQNQQNQPIGGAPLDKHGEFLKGRPPVFSHATDPLEADDWLRAVEKQLNIAQCDGQQKVLYVLGQLQGEAQDWWEAFEYGRPNNVPTIT